MDSWILRGVLVLLSVLLGARARPVGLEPFDVSGPLLGLLAALVILAAERRLRVLEPAILLGGLAGLLAGAGLAAVLRSLLLPDGLPGLPPTVAWGFLLLLCGYAGVGVGTALAGRVTLASLRSAWKEDDRRRDYKILDTSVIIDGRIADVCETGFLDGTLVVPQFVLRELQYIADSQDPIKRNRGRKGLEILQRIKKSADANVLISESDYPEIREVDMKLIELARQLSGKIVTNDFNLNKVAELRGVPVLNLNVLANSLKPVVLPGEAMKVFILKEGKEPNQGVGYLDDGTMVVVDNAKRFLGRNIDITVTSVLQTTAGKMFFGRSESGAEEASSFDQRPRRTGA